MSAIRRERPRGCACLAARRLQEAPVAPARRCCASAGRRPTDQEIVADEVGERLADPVLVARDDRRVRDRQAERMAEQAVTANQSAAADHGRLRERLHEDSHGYCGSRRA
jgi:hypothetical protein